MTVVGRLKGRLLVGVAIVAVVAIATLLALRAMVPASPTSVGDYLGLPDVRKAADRTLVQERAVQALIARCMRDQGFPYVPTTPPTVNGEGAIGPREWAEKWGFGISTRPKESTVQPIADPNLDYLDRLSIEEQEKYRTALFGGGSQTDTATPGGCTGGATETVYRAMDVALRPITPELDRIAARVAADTRMADAEGLWLDCAHGHGLVGDTRAKVVATAKGTVYGRLARIAERNPTASLPPDELAELKATERGLAVAIAECESVRQGAIAAIAAEYEQAFIQAQRALVDSVRNQLERYDMEMSALAAEVE